MDELPATVVLCTYRPGPELVDALEALDRDAPPAAELIIVLSGSVDGSALPAVVQDWLRSVHRSVKVLEEPRVGVAVAKAKGMAVAASDRVLFVDDDISVRDGWYAAMTRSLDHAAAVGGAILPDWPGGKPSWLPSGLATYYGQRIPGAFSVHLPFGANLGVRRTAVEDVGGFRTDLGVHGRTPGLHEDTELCRRLLLAGYRVEDAPEAVVDHRVSPEHLRVLWVLRRAWWEGRSDARRDGTSPGSVVTRLLKVCGLAAAMPVALMRSRWAALVCARLLVNGGFIWEALQAGARNRPGTTDHDETVSPEGHAR